MTRCRTIAVFAYQNGKFGTNTASLARVDQGYLFSNGFYDPMLYRCPVEAKAAFRKFVAWVSA
jgi:hypothetical protein